MKKTLRLFFRRWLFLLTIFLLYAKAMLGQEYSNGIMQGAIRVKIKPEIVQGTKFQISQSKGIVKTGVASIDQILAKYSASQMVRVFPYSERFEAKHAKYGLNQWYLVKFSTKESPLSVAKQFAGISEVAYSEPIYEKVIPKYQATVVDLPKQTKNSFNDPYLGYQWHYNNTGQEGGVPGADINLFKAWEQATGNKNVIVSVHDEGVDYTHEDLAANMWVNQAELNGKPNYDDDGNGYRDDIYGFNFVGYTGNIDKLSHGTHVSGTIAAVNNNGLGVCGVAGGSGNNDGVKIMSCQIIGGSGGLIDESYVYAADNGSVISQNSWGYTSPGYIEQSVLDAIDYFIKEAGSYEGSPMKGGVVIFAAGNSGSDLQHWPGYYENCISVAALNNKSGVTAYSNYGAWVDISAPGGEQKESNKESILSTLPDNRYGYMDGTSMACPHVSGVAALIVSKFASNSFTNQDLRTHLLTGTYNIDTLAINDGYQGKIGVGRADAALALAVDNKIAPNKITDLILKGISQDFGNFSWSVPTDNDDSRPVSFKLYYSTEELTNNNLATAYKVSMPNKIKPGETQDYELQGLKPVTVYWFGVTSIDRWGNESELSNIVKDTTNSGPVASVNETSLQIDVNVTESPSALRNITLNNTGEGILKWTSDIRLVKNIDASSVKKGINYPKISPNLNFKTQLKSANIGNNVVVPYSQKPDDQNYYLYDTWNNMFILGEVDTTYTNSEATRFHVIGDAGFNLTDVIAFVRHNPHKKKAILEIYKGKDIATAQIMLAQEFTSYDNVAYDHSIKLNEQLLFQKDDYFWVVVHIPSGHKYPLGAGYELDKDYSSGCYYSVDLGKNWKMLEEVYYDNRVVWAVHVLSKLKPLDQYLTLNPDNGVVQSNESQTTEVSTDATYLIDGYYKSNVVLQTNDPANPLVRVPVELNVTGHRPIIKSQEILDFGSVLFGLNSTKEIEIKNLGYSKFGGGWSEIQVTISNDEFENVSGYFNMVDALSNATLKFKYTPKKVGNSNAKVTLSDNKGNSYSFNLFGVCAEPPKVMITPADTTATGLNLGDEVKGRFNIKNTGAYPLKYYVPGFANGENIGGLSKYTHRFGYISKVNDGSLAEPAYVWEDISTSGVDVSSAFINNATEDYALAELGFKFPFFGKVETSVYVTKHGVLTFDKNSYFNTSPMGFKNPESPDRFISAWGLEFDLTIGGKIHYKRYSDRFIAQYTDVNYDYWDENWEFQHAKITFQIVLHDNGDINIYYKNLDGIPTKESGWSLICIEDQNIDDGLHINDQNQPSNPPTTGTAILIECPGFGSVKQITNPFGTIQVGDSIQLNYTINTTNLYVGDFKERVSVISNDPFTPVAYYYANMNISTGGEDNLVLTTDTLKFGEVFQRDTKSLSFDIENQGKAVVSIISAGFKNANYTIVGELPVVVKPGSKVGYQVIIDSKNQGLKPDTLTFTDSNGKLYTLPIVGKVVGAPVISVDVAEINETLNYGQTKVVPVTISNTGENPLDVKAFGNEWMTVLQSQTKGFSNNVDLFDYQVLNNYESFISGKENMNPIYNWVDIVETGTKPDTMDPFDPELYWLPLDIPFTFDYYGKSYSKIYIGYNGLIAFTPQSDIYPWGPQENMPSMEGPNNFVAPLWLAATESYRAMYPKTGVYYKVESDRVIVQYQDFMNFFGMGEPISFQVILYKNGNIKFQYQLNRYDATSGFGAVAIENEDGSKGFQICSRQLYLFDKQAIMFIPGQKVTIPVGQSKTFDVQLDATKHFGGTYYGDLNIVNNSPDSSNYVVKATLNIVGEVNVQKPDSIDFGNVTILPAADAWPPFKSYSQEFSIKNIGSQNLNIDAISLVSGGTNEYSAEVYQYDESGWFPGWVWNPIDWAITPIKVIPSDELKLRVTITPTGALVDAKDTLLFTCNYGEGYFKIPLSALEIEPPIMVLTPEEITVNADNKTYTTTEVVTIDNTQGKSDLNYKLEIAFDREVATSTVNTIKTDAVNSSSLSLQSTKISAIKIEKAGNGTYNRVLEYDTQTAPSTALGYGGESEFTTATKFVAPSDGFNLTHVAAYYIANQWLNSNIQVSILAGSTDIFSAKEIYTQSFSYNITSPEPSGAYITIPLTTNQIFYPNETFFVVIKYPMGAAFPQGCAEFTTPKEGFFYYGNGSNWWDIATTAQFTKYGWMVKAAEEKFLSNSWVVLDSPAEDVVKPGESKDVKLFFNAGFAKQGLNTATMNIASNDAVRMNATVALNLHLNSGPSINFGKAISVSMTEGDIFERTYEVKDLEHNTYTITSEGKPSFVTLTEGTNSLTLKVAPGLSDAGSYAMKLIGTDSYGNASEITVDIYVTNKNQAPKVVQTVGDNNMSIADPFAFLDLTALFTDPDGDVLKYTVSSSSVDVVDLFLSSTGLLVKPLKTGLTTVTLTATDPQMAYASLSWKVNVLSTGIETNTSDEGVTIYPTVTTGLINIKFEKPSNTDVRIEVYNSIGCIQKSKVVREPSQTDINLADCPAGIYLVKIKVGNRLILGKVIKN